MTRPSATTAPRPGGGTIGFDQPRLRYKEIVGALARNHIAAQQVEAVATGPFGRAQRSAAIPDPVDQPLGIGLQARPDGTERRLDEGLLIAEMGASQIISKAKDAIMGEIVARPVAVENQRRDQIGMQWTSGADTYIQPPARQERRRSQDPPPTGKDFHSRSE